MTNREMRAGAAMAGVMLLAIPVVELLVTRGMPGPVHALIAAFGIGLLAVWATGGR
jgi:hypothetical protein